MDNQINNHIELRPVKDLLGMNFFIPSYQRGYRWKTRQVQDLLEDIKEFIGKGAIGNYCLQPLVVRRHNDKKDVFAQIQEALNKKDISEIKNLLNEQWDVVDGQQRLTTLFILLKYLNGGNIYQLSYATRPDSPTFLNEIGSNNQNSDINVDFKHFGNTYTVIHNWFNNHKNVDRKAFLETILNKTEFIWYESEEKDPIEVFTRLNIGKISLTNSELVKALFLNISNLQDNYLRQNEVAILWDQMEHALQKDEFWCFFHDDEYRQPTRIDFILELVEMLNNIDTNQDKKSEDYKGITWYINKKELGSDKYKTFRYYYRLLKKNKKKNSCQNMAEIVWKEIRHTFDLLYEWYNDNECYHYIGFLLSINKEDYLKGLFETWRKKKSKEEFACYLKEEIRKVLNAKKIGRKEDLERQYEIDTEDGRAAKKRECLPILLLFNIQSVVEKNKMFKENEKFETLDFERFPFNLYKKEKGWDIEHIAPNTAFNLPTEKERLEWLELAQKGGSFVDEISNYITNHTNLQDKDHDSEPDKDFEDLRGKLEGANSLDYSDRNKLWNFCLLDSSTNRSYGNSTFALKRKEILLRERGMDFEENPLVIDDSDSNAEKLKKRRVFIPTCTLNAFTKFYSANATDLSVWGKYDAGKYLEAIKQTLSVFLNDSPNQ